MRGLVIASMFALAVVAGCSQNAGPAPTALPAQAAPTVADPAAAVRPGPPAARTLDQTRARGAGRGFVPLDSPAFLTASQAGYLGDEDLVLGVEWAGEVRAYPARMLRYHHIVNDIVGDEPLLVTY